MSWQPIESAPKDGTFFLSCTGGNVYCPIVTVWATYHPNAPGRACWRTSNIAGNLLGPEYWMPLPEPPK